MLCYLVVFLAAVATDLIPLLGPPAWIVMAFMLVKFDLNPWLVLLAGVPGSVLGRYGLSLYVPSVVGTLLAPGKSEDIRFAGEQLNGSRWRSWPFVLLYSLLPLSTTALFSAAGLARIRPAQILPPFFIGKFISDAIMVFLCRHTVDTSVDIFTGSLSEKAIASAVAGTLLLAAFVFLDWRLLIERRVVRLNFRVWR